MSKPIDSSLRRARPARSDGGQTEPVSERVEFNYDYPSPSEGPGMLLSELLEP